MSRTTITEQEIAVEYARTTYRFEIKEDGLLDPIQPAPPAAFMAADAAMRRAQI